MKKNYLRMFWGNSVIFTLLYIMCLSDIVNTEGKKIMPPIVIIVYSISVLVTCIIPMIKLIHRNK
jgi:hypothetical protein